jgi:hypothetical protein
MKRMRQPKLMGEVDLVNHTLVYLPTPKGIEKAWVKIEQGDKFDGKGIIDSEPRAAMLGRSKFRLGDRIEYGGGTGRVLPKFIKKIKGSGLSDLKESVAKGLAEAMTFNPKKA